jgi:DNA-binding NarL/FixJ family response regulator
MATRERPVRAVVIDDSRELRADHFHSGLPVAGLADDVHPDAVHDRHRQVEPIIRALVPDARIIVLSAFSGAVREQVLDWGADGYLVKGTPLKKIVEYVEASLGD